jgi:sulfofructose kinase
MDKCFDIIGLGYCGLDRLCVVPRIPVDDKVEILENLVQGGGPSATAIVAAARLGAKTTFIGAVGDDDFGEAILEEFRREGVDTDSVEIQKDAASPSAYCWIDAQTGSRSIAWSRGSISPMSPSSLPEEMIRSAKLLHLDGHHTQAAVAAAEIARSAGVTVSLDAGTMLDGIDKLVELADIIIASEMFAAKFTGAASAGEALRYLYDSGDSKFAGVTMGADGSIGFDSENKYRQPAFPVEVVDTTGAGDVFHGAFAYRYTTGGDWAECMRFAAAVSAMKCTKLGGRSGIPTLVEAERFLSGQDTA